MENERPDDVPDLYLSEAGRALRAADALSKISPLAAMAELRWAAADYERAAGRLLCDKLAALGYTEAQMEAMTAEGIRRLVPNEMDAISNTIQGLGGPAQQALARQADDTQNKYGPLPQ